MATRISGITVEIGGDTTKLQTALKGVNSEIKSTETQLKDVEKLLKLDPTNTELLAQKQALLTKAIDETSTKLETLKTASEQANTALANGEISQRQYDALQREIIATEQSLRSLTEQAEISNTALQKIANTGESLKSVGDNVSSAGTKMLGATAVITGLGTAAVATATSFESSMSQVQATMGITSDSMSMVDGQAVNTMDSLEELAQQMGKSTKFSASECAEALNYLALAGYDTQQTTDTLPKVLNLAASGGMSLASASDMLTDSMSALGLGADDAGVMVDQMAKTASNANTSVAELGEGILTIGATAKSMAGGTAELNTALGLLADNGIKGSEGGTALRNIIMSLQSPTDKASASLENLGVSVYDSQGNMRELNDILGDLNSSMGDMTSQDRTDIINTIFNKTDIAAVNTLLDSTGNTWENLQQTITDSTGTAQQMADVQMDNLQGQLTTLQAALEGLAISFGKILLPAIKSIASSLQNFVDWLNSMDETTQKVIVGIGIFVASLGPVLIVVGKIISAVGTIMTVIPTLVTAITTVKTAFFALNATMLANPIPLLITAIAGLMVYLVRLYQTNETVREICIAVWEAIKTAFLDGANSIISFLGVIIDFIGNNWQAILLTIVNPFAGAFKLLYDNCEAFRTFIDNLLQNLISIISTSWTNIKTTISSAITNIQTFVTTGFTNMLTAITSTVSNIVTAIKDGFNGGVNYIKDLISQSTTWGKDLIMGMVDGIKSSIGAMTSAVKDVANTIWSYLHFTVPEVGPLTDYETWMPDFMEGLAKGINSSKSLVTNAVDGLASDMILSPNAQAVDFNITSNDTPTTDTSSIASAITNALGNIVGGDTVIPIYLGGTMLDEVIINATQRTNLRSGGR